MRKSGYPFHLFKDFHGKGLGIWALFVYQGSTQTMAITTAITIKEINTKSTGPAFMGGITAKVILGFLGTIPIFLKTSGNMHCFRVLRKEL